MSFDQTIQRTQQWGLTAESLGALGAYLSLLGSDGGDPGVRDRLRELTDAAGLPDLEQLEPPQRAMITALARTALKQALDLLEAPTRAPGWAYDDPGVLDGWGRGSSAVPGMIVAVAPEIGDVKTLLDVGTGVGLLAVAATKVWRDVSVVGIDNWEPALDRAHKHVADAGLTDRIELRYQEVTALDDVDRFDLAWVPTFFLTEEDVEAATAAVVRAVKPGGYIVLGRFLPLPDPVANAMLALRTYRFGGHLLDEARSVELLEKNGCTNVRVAAAPPPVQMSFTVGTKPAS